MEIPKGKGRLGWFDAMRGLAIIAVVLGHVLIFSLRIPGSIICPIVYAFHMPLFFFISGFFGYRACENWTLARSEDFVRRKFQALIICTLIFFVLKTFCSDGLHSHIRLSQYGGNVLECIHDGFFLGYWFTIVLFQMFVIFLTLSLLSKLFKSERILEIGLILVSLAGVIVLATKLLDDSLLWGVLCTKNFCIYFQFFALGIFCRKYQTLFESIISKNWFKTGITICAVACTVLYFQDGFEDFCRPLARFIRALGASYAILLLVVAFFFAKREFFENDTRECAILNKTQNGTSSCLRYVGQRTLDIYMIHYFFLPDLSALKDWIAPNSMFVVQLTIGLVVSALIIALCLLLSEILRLSSFLSAWLFGVKSRE